MLDGKKIVVVMPARNVEKTLERTVHSMPPDVADEIILVDNRSRDRTCEIAERLHLHVVRHDRDRGYGGSQKTCYREALQLGADVVVMLHPDGQYPPEKLVDVARLVTSGQCDLGLGSRILGGGAMNRGMPLYKFLSNRFLTHFENLCLGLHLSEYHTGYRAFSQEFLLRVPFVRNSDDYIFDNQIIAQAVAFGFRIAEVSTPTVYTNESTSVPFFGSIIYGLGVLRTSLQYCLYRWGIAHPSIFLSTEHS
ncbi:MAG: glycosyltransferase family 2 protein [Candidatus Peribacteraceae bacterium]|nr:glycosyltransferase family 2 protein [Candidatus Peribacteraceae bacterium]MDD5741996.1 glycosyltransferase family 2 protein [Candidatus Peribacteraceae bacterium]